MLPYLILLGCILVVVVILLTRWYVSADPKAIIKFFKWVLIIFFSLLGLFFLFTGRLSWVFLSLPLILPIIMRLRALRQTFKAFSRMRRGGASRGTTRSSTVQTDMLNVTLDQETGDIRGTILKGPLKGKRIEELTQEMLIEFLEVCRNEDPDSAQIIEVYLDRIDPKWRKNRHSGGYSTTNRTSGIMDEQEALMVLGLEAGATEKEIKESYHNLIRNLHPDRGGSDYLAAKINQAKECLLGK